MAIGFCAYTDSRCCLLHRGVSISYDGRKLVTIGSEGCINLWDISTEALEAAVVASACRPDRWSHILANADLLNDLHDYFYYAQVSGGVGGGAAGLPGPGLYSVQKKNKKK